MCIRDSPHPHPHPHPHPEQARNSELEEELAGVRAEREATRRKLDVQLRERDIENKHLTKAGSTTRSRSTWSRSTRTRARI